MFRVLLLNFLGLLFGGLLLFGCVATNNSNTKAKEPLNEVPKEVPPVPIKEIKKEDIKPTIFKNIEVFNSGDIVKFITTYSYNASDNDSKNSSRVIATKEIKNLLLAEVGVFIKNEYSIVLSSNAKKEITDNTLSLSAGITQLKILNEEWNGITYTIKAEVSIDKRSVKENIEKLVDNKQLLEDLKNSQKRSQEALTKLKKLQQQNKNLKDEVEVLKAKQTYQKEIYTLSAEEYFNKGVNAQEMLWHEDAIKHYKKAIEINPNLHQAYNNLGITYKTLQRYDEAIRAYKKAIEINPNDDDAYYNLGNTYANLQRYDEAIRAYKKAIEINPNDDAAYNNLGVVYTFGKKDYKMARYYVKKAIQLGNDSGLLKYLDDNNLF